MTLDQAIKHAEEVAEEKLYEFQECVAVHDTEDAMACRKCGEEHEQLAEWLKELKQLRKQTNWIPVSERLPEKDVEVLATTEWGNDVLDKIRAEIKALSPEPTAYDVVDGNPIKDAIWETLSDVLQIIDKYKAGSEE